MLILFFIVGVRLVGVGSAPNKGYVQISGLRPNGDYEWGPICDDDFHAEEATIVCKMLGYEGYCGDNSGIHRATG